MEIERWMFGDQADLLADRVLKGTKTATCALYNGEVSQPLNIIVNSQEEDICMIEIYEYKILKYSEMTNQMAVAEGERNLYEWREIHKRYFSSKLGISERDFDESTKIIYYLFRVIEKY
jgi:Uncharacterized protein conserved in bacteria